MEKSRLIPIICLNVIILVLASLSQDAFGGNCDRARRVYDETSRLTDHQLRRQGFEKAVSLCPNFAEARVNLADAYENLALQSKAFSENNLKRNNELIDKAVEEYKIALKHNPGVFEAYLGLAENYFRIGLYRKSIEAFEKALQVNPSHTLTSRAKSGLKAVRKAAEGDGTSFRTAENIIRLANDSNADPKFGRIMGFEGYTKAASRQRFNNILFDTMSHELNRKEALEQLQEIGKALSSDEMKHSKFVIEGHTDSRGGKEMNLSLSKQRAEAVKEYLTKEHNIEVARITSQGYGYERPRVPNDSEENMLQNRRVELIIMK